VTPGHADNRVRPNVICTGAILPIPAIQPAEDLTRAPLTNFTCQDLSQWPRGPFICSPAHECQAPTRSAPPPLDIAPHAGIRHAFPPGLERSRDAVGHQHPAGLAHCIVHSVVDDLACRATKARPQQCANCEHRSTRSLIAPLTGGWVCDPPAPSHSGRPALRYPSMKCCRSVS
jgi:hypothetical protein